MLNFNFKLLRVLLGSGQRKLKSGGHPGAPVEVGDQNGKTPLHDAARWNRNPKGVEILLEHEALINASDDDGNAPLNDAFRWNSMG